MEALIDKLEGPRILVVRGLRVILDEDLARLYGVTTKALNQAVRRNPRRFPAAFVISVANEDLTNLKSQNVTSSLAWGGRRKPAFAFTEHGALMVASVLNSDRAIAMSVYVIKAFVKMREELTANETVLRRLAEMDKTLLIHDEGLRDLYQKLMPLLELGREPEKRKIGFRVKEENGDKGGRGPGCKNIKINSLEK
jgi:phage regulator Rha-like protein